MLRAGFATSDRRRPGRVVALVVKKRRRHQPTFHLFPAVHERRGSIVSAALSLSRRYKQRDGGRYPLPIPRPVFTPALIDQ